MARLIQETQAQEEKSDPIRMSYAQRRFSRLHQEGRNGRV
jgi:hypothetical protein